MNVEFLSRLQFAFTIAFHYIYPPLSIGLGVALVIMEGFYLKTKNPVWQQMTKFWVKVFALTFALGVATGIVMEFEFGTNWATYSRFVGDVFGSALAAEGIFAFFLESGFLAILVFGWNKVSPKVHFFSTIMVSLGSMLSAVWIVVANSWMQTPAGFHIVGEGLNARAEITDFWAMVFNPSSVDRLTHTLSGAWLAGAFLIMSIAAFYIIKKRNIDFAQKSFKVGLGIAVFASLFQLFTGHQSAVGVSKNQPAKLAAIEAHYDSNAVADLYLYGWVDENQREVKFGIALPKFLTFLVHNDFKTPIRGLDSFDKKDLPPINIVFQTYHLMVAIGMALIGLSLLALFLLWRGTLFRSNWLMKTFVLAVLLPQIANQVGWYSAEIGRQPWIVYNLLRTSDALSKAVVANQVLFSLILFTLIYALLLVLFLFLLNEKIKHGPEDIESLQSEYEKQKILLAGK
ncbi:MAG TPA: cytochrome ubiquinol oxidase subunit I [Ignavibacteriaceae bacterium]|jgi:cytochrome d ubiquinol oxidase subunit I|nr:cytochrome ubiquinol oxidase subunit I [Ignavibacteriaceae bacterium]HOJ19136.1 cytochrome ubiquinol oxidase subunit I [Ignavibacteriaceae bacterium]HPO54655.1 cytochrome ubiquinol oxidase subunit I [Ignavibacteriaceae bacterium]